ncbi:mesothelin-like protein isoform X2 [Dromaius novaehollandiae]|uniref:mesothelin-like protein isoform X2 n=1 Tax=Dromaius novaehollandiae TaxID=8790 RepID=UPI00311F8B3E
MAPALLAACLLCLRLSTDFATAASAADSTDPAALVDLLASSAPRSNATVLTMLMRSHRSKGHLVARPRMALGALLAARIAPSASDTGGQRGRGLAAGRGAQPRAGSAGSPSAPRWPVAGWTPGQAEAPRSKLVSNASSLGDVLTRVPDRLADRLPGSRLTFPVRSPDLGRISRKRWSPEQGTLRLSSRPGAVGAAVLSGAALSGTARRAACSASVLRGFQCSSASALSAAETLSLAKEVRNRRVALSSPQLSCLARLLAAKNLTANFAGYPPDVLLFFDFAGVHNRTCKAFYALASQGNLDLLPKGSTRRTQLLRRALACLAVSSTSLSPEQLGSLGALVCDMEPAVITASHPSVLENLKLCPALSGAQRAALNAVLLGGATAYGYPSSWDLRSLQSLGPLVLSLNQTVLTSVAEGVRKAFCRTVAAEYRSQGVSQREKSVTLLKAFATASSSSRRRLKRSTKHCLSAPVVASTISDPLFLLSYDTSEQFDLCLSNEVLKANLALLLEQPLTVEYLHVVKKKISEIYPEGIPENQLRLFGQLSHQYTAEEISTWRVTSSDTLAALLDPTAGKWKAPEAQHLITRYLDLGGTLTGPLLQKIGGRNLCNLAEDHICRITPEAIGSAGQLDISSCSQDKKDQLYIKAQEAFAGQAGTRAYYSLIQPYLGGAPAKDLKDLAKTGIDMDIGTFTALNPDELQKLTVMDVKNLLGVNLPDLKQAENHPSVISWIKRQDQRELDHILGIGLQGGMVEPSSTGSATPANTTPSASIAPTTAVLATTALPAVTTNSHSTVSSSTSTHTPPTPSAISPAVPNSTPPHAHTTLPGAGGSPAVTPRPTARPALTPSSTNPCSIHQPATSKATSPATALTTTPAAVNPSTTSPGFPPPPALTRNATTTSSAVVNPAVTTPNTSTPTVPINPPVPGGTTNPAPTTHNTTTASTRTALSALAPNITSAPVVTTATETNTIPHKPTPIPSTSVSTQKGAISSTAKMTTFNCKTGAPPAFLSPSSTTTSRETTKKTPTEAPEPQNPTPFGYINLQPEAGSGCRLSCLLHVLTAALGISLLQGLL